MGRTTPPAGSVGESANADGANNTTTQSVADARISGYNGTTWDRIRTAVVTITATVTGYINVIPWARFNTTPTTRTNGQGGPLETDNAGSLLNRETYAPGYEDNVANVAKVEQRYSYLICAADVQVKAGAGFLHTLTFSCNDAAPTAGSIIVYDSLTETGTQIFNHTFTTTPFAPCTVTIDASFATGLYMGFTTTADVNITVSYR